MYITVNYTHTHEDDTTLCSLMPSKSSQQIKTNKSSSKTPASPTKVSCIYYWQLPVSEKFIQIN